MTNAEKMQIAIEVHSSRSAERLMEAYEEAINHEEEIVQWVEEDFAWVPWAGTELWLEGFFQVLEKYCTHKPPGLSPFDHAVYTAKERLLAAYGKK